MTGSPVSTSLSDLQIYLESVEFDAQMQVFSGFKTFYSALEASEAIAQFVQVIAGEPTFQQQVFARLAFQTQCQTQCQPIVWFGFPISYQ